jgi:hypothetical protein
MKFSKDLYESQKTVRKDTFISNTIKDYIPFENFKTILEEKYFDKIHLNT